MNEPPSPSCGLVPSGRRPVALARAVADFSEEGFDVAEALNANSKNGKGWAVAPHQGQPHEAVFLAEAPVAIDGPVELTFQLTHAFKNGGYTLGRFRLSATTNPAATRRASVPALILAVLDTPADQRGPEQVESLARHYRSIAPALEAVARRDRRAGEIKARAAEAADHGRTAARPERASRTS